MCWKKEFGILICHSKRQCWSCLRDSICREGLRFCLLCPLKWRSGSAARLTSVWQSYKIPKLIDAWYQFLFANQFKMFKFVSILRSPHESYDFDNLLLQFAICFLALVAIVAAKPGILAPVAYSAYSSPIVSAYSAPLVASTYSSPYVHSPYVASAYSAYPGAYYVR